MKKIKKTEIFEYNPIWNNYITGESKQEFASSATSRPQKPRVFMMIKDWGLYKGEPILLDIGCGKGNEEFKSGLIDLGIKYYGIDPFNKSKDENINAINKTQNGKANIVTINNVLNTIKEKEVRLDILKQAKNALNPETGLLMIIIYEGVPNRIEKEQGLKRSDLKPIKTTGDGWQNRAPTKSYINTVKEIFPNVRLTRHPQKGQVILASINPELELTPVA